MSTKNGHLSNTTLGPPGPCQSCVASTRAEQPSEETVDKYGSASPPAWQRKTPSSSGGSPPARSKSTSTAFSVFPGRTAAPFPFPAVSGRGRERTAQRERKATRDLPSHDAATEVTCGVSPVLVGSSAQGGEPPDVPPRAFRGGDQGDGTGLLPLCPRLTATFSSSLSAAFDAAPCGTWIDALLWEGQGEGVIWCPIITASEARY